MDVQTARNAGTLAAVVNYGFGIYDRAAHPADLYLDRGRWFANARLEEGLARVREATNGFTVPSDASETWRRCYRELARFEQAVHAHLRAENDVLFPRALELEQRLS